MIKNKQKKPKKHKVNGSNKVNSKRVMTILGIVLCISSIGLFTWYEFLGGRQFLHYQDIVVANESIKKGQVIQEANLTFMKVEKKQLAEGVLLDSNDVVGKQANHFIPQMAQIDKSYLSENGLVLDEGKFIAQIPVEWTLSIPDTLRRGDDIVMYSAMYDTELLKQLQSSSSAQSSTSKSATTTPSVKPTVTSNGSSLEELLKTKVAYVKDGANREVVTVSPGDRIDGSAAIGSVEIITTPEEFNKIESKINTGHKLIFMYTDNPLLEEDTANNGSEDSSINVEPSENAAASANE